MIALRPREVDVNAGWECPSGPRTTVPWLVDDETWAAIEPILPPWPARAPGPRPVDDRRCLQGILFVLFTGISWQQLPMELGFGSGQTCWRRLCRWTEAGILDQIQGALSSRSCRARRIDWVRVGGAAHARQYR